jgi:hypothetical protein
VSGVLDDVRAVLRTTPGRWEVLVRGLPAGLLERSPRAGEWSAVECLRHLVEAERVFTTRVRSFLSGKPIAAFDPDRQARPRRGRATDLGVELTRLRASSLALLETLTADDLRRRTQHEEYGEVTLEQMLNEWAAHDLMHTVQAERAVMQPFLPGTGPWRPLFADHDLAVGAAP